MNYLKAVFWDYPKFTNKKYLKKYLLKNKNKTSYKWILYRFLENGRAVDTFSYFKKEEIVKLLPELKLSEYSFKKWKRIMEVYNESKRK